MQIPPSGVPLDSSAVHLRPRRLSSLEAQSPLGSEDTGEEADQEADNDNEYPKPVIKDLWHLYKAEPNA